MRNRQYLPRLGRFLQPDPNATGVAVQPSLAYGGSALPTPDPYVDLHSWAADGTNPLAYALSDPVNGADPTGLFWGGMLGALGTGMEMMDLASDEIDAGFTGVLGGLGLIMMVDEYVAFVDTAMEWAADWNEPDDAYARSATWSSGTGSWSEVEQDKSARVELGSPRIIAGVHDHHGFPQEFSEEFRRIGIDVDNPKYRVKLTDRYHLRVVHGRNKGRNGGPYNQFWQDFFKKAKGSNASRRLNAIKKLEAIKQNRWRIPQKWRR
jgi:hypothetical protein